MCIDLRTVHCKEAGCPSEDDQHRAHGAKVCSHHRVNDPLADDIARDCTVSVDAQYSSLLAMLFRRRRDSIANFCKIRGDGPYRRFNISNVCVNPSQSDTPSLATGLFFLSTAESRFSNPKWANGVMWYLLAAPASLSLSPSLQSYRPRRQQRLGFRVAMHRVTHRYLARRMGVKSLY